MQRFKGQPSSLTSWPDELWTTTAPYITYMDWQIDRMTQKPGVPKHEAHTLPNIVASHNKKDNPQQTISSERKKGLVFPDNRFQHFILAYYVQHGKGLLSH
jgi:hypothetical protein